MINPMIRQRYYNPGQLTDAELKAGFVVRQYEFKELGKIIRQEPASGPLQHILILGPRGMGKTSLGLRALVEVRETPELAAQWQPVPFFEESYGVSDLAALWLTALHHLSDATKEQEWAKRADALLAREKDAERLAAGAYAALADYRRQSGKRPILFVENLDELFAQFLNKQDLARLRSLLQERNDLLLLGTANSVFEAITSHGEPFYEFFRQVKLRGLERPETMSFLHALAERPDLRPLREVLDKDPGRVEAVRSLTGGNPRLIALAAKMMSESPVGTAREDLERLIDDQTPYFKARIETLPPQARVVFHTLAAGWSPMLASEVAAEARLTSSHASAQLKYLTERGYTETVEGPTKRSRRYQILERFYNVYYLLRFTRDQKVRLERLIDFISAIFGKVALSRMAMATVERMIEASQSSDDDSNVLNILIGKINKEYEGTDLQDFWIHLVDICENGNIDDTGFLIFGLDHISACRNLDIKVSNILKKQFSQNPSNTRAWLLQSLHAISHGDLDVARTALYRLTSLDKSECAAWLLLGTVLTSASQYQEAISALRHAVSLDPQHEQSWETLASAFSKQNECKKAKFATRISSIINPFSEWATEKLLELAVTQDPKNIRERNRIARRLIAINPSNEIAMMTMALDAAEKRNFNSSKFHFARASSIASDGYGKIMNILQSSNFASLAGNHGESIDLIIEASQSELDFPMSSIPEETIVSLFESVTDAYVSGHKDKVKTATITGWLATTFEPLRYAMKLDMGEEIGPIPTEMREAVEEARRQIAARRAELAEGDGRHD